MNELEIIQYRQIEGLSIFFDTVDYRTSHVHPEWELIWVLDAPLSVTCGQSRFTVHEGQIVLFSPNEPHEFHKDGQSTTFLCLQISEAILPKLRAIRLDSHIVDENFSLTDFASIKDALSDIMRAYWAQKENYELFCIGQSMLILSRLLEAMPSHTLTSEEAASLGKRNDRLLRLIAFVDENYMHKIRLADFAEAEGCSVSYLSRFIKDTMNQNFQDYVTSVRFNCACKLIASGEKRLLDVCLGSGFSDYRYFSREFKKQYGMTPEEYRKYTQKRRLEMTTVRHSLHSVERFYTKEESLTLMHKFFQK